MIQRSPRADDIRLYGGRTALAAKRRPPESIPIANYSTLIFPLTVSSLSRTEPSP